MVASQYIGSRDKENGDLAASQLVMITSLIAFCMTAVVLLFGRQIFGLLFRSVEEDVLESGLVYLRISAWSFPFLAVYNGCAGLFRSMGKTKTLMNVSIISTVVCRVVLSVLFGIVLNLGVIGITLAMVADWGIHAALIGIRYMGGKWKNYKVI